METKLARITDKSRNEKLYACRRGDGTYTGTKGKGTIF